MYGRSVDSASVALRSDARGAFLDLLMVPIATGRLVAMMSALQRWANAGPRPHHWLSEPYVDYQVNFR